MRPYVESVPQLRATEIARHGLGRVVFAIKGRGVRMQADLTSADNVLTVDLYRDGGAAEGERPDRFKLNVTKGRAGAIDVKIYFECEGCGKPRDVVYLHLNTWRCRKCHDLKYRSQYMPQEQKDGDEYQSLLHQAIAGRQRYERHSAWQSKLERLQELESKPRYTKGMHSDQSRLTYTSIYDLSDFDEDDWKPQNDELPVTAATAHRGK